MQRTLMYALMRVQEKGNTWESVTGETPILGSSVADAMVSAHAARGEHFGVWTIPDSLCVYEVAKHRTKKHQPDFVAISIEGLPI